MIPVDQSILTDPSLNIVGNSFQACVASILELPLDMVPYFHSNRNNGQGWYVFRQWLVKNQDMEVATFPPHTGYFIKFYADCYYIVSGWSSRNNTHNCVGFNNQIVHDPHPSRDGLVTQESYTVMIPRDPVRRKLKEQDSGLL